MSNLWADLRYSIRQLRKSPGFTVTAILTLALGIGANTGMFTALEAMLLRALPIQDAQRVVYITENNSPDNVMETGNSPWTFTMPVFQQLRQEKKIFSGVAAYVPLSFGKVDARVGHIPMTTEADMVSGNFFQMLGVPMLRGHAFGLQDEQRHAQVVVLGYNFWTRAFSRNPDVIGQTMFIKGVPFTIVGVASKNFVGVEPATKDDFWIPLQDRPDLPAWGYPPSSSSLYGSKPWQSLMMMGRLAPGQTKRSAEAALNPMLVRIWYSTLGRTIPPKLNLGVTLVPATGIGPLNDTFQTPLRMAMGLVLLVLLIACTNVAMLVLARNAARQREFAVRVALGAGRATLLRQLLAESVLLVVAGAGLGWAFAAWAAPMLARSLAAQMDFQTNMTPDSGVLGFTLAVASLATLVFGLAPFVSVVRVPPTLAMKSGSATANMGRTHGLGRRAAVSAQVALCVVCLVAAALMVRTLRQYQTEDLGIRTHGLLTFGVTPTGNRTPEQAAEFYRDLLNKLRALPGVESATVVEDVPGRQVSDNNGLVLDGVLQHGRSQKYAQLRTDTVGPGFFHVLGIPILRGRGITAADTANAPPVVIVNQTFVDRFLPHTDPLGHTIGGAKYAYTIVGVARDSKYTSVDEKKMPMAWYPYMQVPAVLPMSVELHATGDPLAILPTVRKAIAQIDPNLPLEDPQTQQALFDSSYFFNTLTAELTTFFGLLAALLVAIGLYGTLAYRVGRRTQEIGVRMALGASRENVQWMVLRESLGMVALGIVVGAPLSLVAGKAMQSQLYKLSWDDPLAMLGALFTVLIVAALASWLPARRAASIDPMQALRSE